jgi:hypothetical protein
MKERVPKRQEASAVADSSLQEDEAGPILGVKNPGDTHLDDPRALRRLSFLLSLLSGLLFLCAGMHVHADRTRRNPVVTWEPIGACLAIAAAVAWCAAASVAFFSLRRLNASFGWALLQMCCLLLGLFGFLLFLGEMYED